MTVVPYSLDFEGYYIKSADLPAYSGIYCVYACTHDAHNRKVSIRKLLYIGESEDIHDRVSYHERRKDWTSQLRSGEVLCFNAAPFSPKEIRERAEAAMIHRHQPPCNKEYVNSFPFNQITIKTNEMAACLMSCFTVYCTTGGMRW